jgi:hypothetical protein
MVILLEYVMVRLLIRDGDGERKGQGAAERNSREKPSRRPLFISL